MGKNKTSERTDAVLLIFNSVSSCLCVEKKVYKTQHKVINT